MILGNAIALPCAQAMVMQPYKKQAGAAAAMSGGGTNGGVIDCKYGIGAARVKPSVAPVIGDCGLCDHHTDQRSARLCH